MGCDIHMLLQHKERGTWVDKEILNIDRDYSLFGVLAGVRGTYEVAIDMPRGLPKDFIMHDVPSGCFDRENPPNEYVDKLHPTILTKDDDYRPGYYNLGEHSFSYLTLYEINKYKHWDKIGFVDQNFRDLFFKCPNLKNWRIVFGFDS